MTGSQRIRHTLLACSALFPLALADAATAGAPFLSDGFEGTELDAKTWYIPTYQSPTDGTYVGRTQFRVTQDSALPKVSDHAVCIPLQSFNPKGGAFYGTEIITKQSFAAETGLDVVIRARMQTARHPGIVGGIFLYYLEPGSNTLHDEIDFEMLTNQPDQIQTNIYGGEPLGAGHPQQIPYHTGTIADFHTYEIKWTPSVVSWLVDGELVRTTDANIPKHPMSLYLNIWAPDQFWAKGYSASIQPAASADKNETLDSLCVSSVLVQPLAP